MLARRNLAGVFWRTCEMTPNRPFCQFSLGISIRGAKSGFCCECVSEQSKLRKPCWRGLSRCLFGSLKPRLEL